MMNKEDIINEILDYTLPKLRPEYGGFTFPRSFIAQMFQGVAAKYHEKLVKNGINPSLYGLAAPDIVKYICGWHYAFTKNMPEQKRIEACGDPEYRNMLISGVTESIFVLENIKTSAVRIINEYNPIYCRFNIMLDYLLSLGIRAQKSNKHEVFAAVIKLFEKAFLKAKGILMLISKGLEQEAIVVWRNLHELECVLAILCENDESVIKEFQTFDRFSADTEKMDEETKAEYDKKIAEFNINIKNNNEVDHFENYGWLAAIPGQTLTKWNLNFRYLEELAGLSEKYKEYQIACDASHMNGKILKWNKIHVLDFVVKRCFNSVLFIIKNFTKFLEKYNIPVEHPIIGKMIGELKAIIDVFLK